MIQHVSCCITIKKNTKKVGWRKKDRPVSAFQVEHVLEHFACVTTDKTHNECDTLKSTKYSIVTPSRS